ncbi:MAG TPA: hypothetical protein VEA40_15740 [Ramlibacter sp.]|nr:hypothetical protein [Ramlibacter sp.]
MTDPAAFHEWVAAHGLLARAEERVIEWQLYGNSPPPEYLRTEVEWLRGEVLRLAASVRLPAV